MQEQHLHSSAWALHSTGATQSLAWTGAMGHQRRCGCSGQESGAGQELGTPGQELHPQGQVQVRCRAHQGFASTHDAEEGDPRVGPVGLSLVQVQM